MKIEVNRDWTEFLSALIGQRVRFVVVGGHAVAGHGEPRLTEDLDVFVDPTVANARRLKRALRDFGFGAVAPAVNELAKPDKVFMLGQKPYRIDILTSIDGVSFAEAWSSRVEADFEVHPLYVIGREALITNKRTAAREKDLADIALLARHRPEAVAKRAVAKRTAALEVRIEGVVQARQKGAAVAVPFDPGETWGAAARKLGGGRRGYKVKARIGNVVFDGEVVPRSGRFWLILPRALCEELEIVPSDEVFVRLTP